MNELTSVSGSPFDSIRRVREDGSEYWDARELQPQMDYGKWENFAAVVEKAKASLALVEGRESAEHHFPTAGSEGGRWGNQQLDNYELTRFGSYLTAMAGDDTKRAVAEARIYFAVRAREAETATGELDELEVAERYVAALRRNRSLEKRNAELEPAAHAWDTLIVTGRSWDVGYVAKRLTAKGAKRCGRNLLYAKLREIGWVFQRSQEPRQEAVDRGFVIPEDQGTRTNEDTGGTVENKPRTRIKPDGVTFLSDLYGVSLTPDELDGGVQIGGIA